MHQKNTSKKIFLKAMLLTVCAVFLILIGYLGAGYLFGDF